MIPRILHTGRGPFPHVYVLEWERVPADRPSWLWDRSMACQYLNKQGPYMVAILKEQP